MRCYEAVQETALTKRRPHKDSNPSATSYVPQSPIGVLDAASLSYKSDDTTTVGSQPDSQNSSPAPAPAAKKRKI